MIDLKAVLDEHPGCLSSRASFKSILMDKYPSEKRVVNILVIMFECGVAQRIQGMSRIEERDVQALVLQLENEHGIAPKYSRECVHIWAAAFGTLAPINTSHSPSASRKEPIVHAPIVDDVVIEGPSSDFETRVRNGGLLEIAKFVGFDEPEMIIPNQIDGVRVISIGAMAFAKCAGVEKVIVPEGIEMIRDGAFSECESLKTVLLPTTLKEIGGTAFAETAIASIDLPAGLKVLGAGAFRGCRNLTHINLPNGIKDIPEYCFRACGVLKEVLLPDNLATIQAYAFAYTGLKQIDIPPSCTEIGMWAFEHCGSLDQITLHEGLRRIGKGAFARCPLLRAITIPNSVTEIGKEVFEFDWRASFNLIRNGCSARENDKDLSISCYAGSYGLEYARKEGYRIKNAAK